MSVPIKVLSVALAAYFIFIGASKVTPRINPTLYYTWLKLYKTFTIDTLRGPVKDMTGYLIKSKYLRRGIGSAEAFAGLLLLPFLPKFASNFANIILIALNGFTVAMHLALNKGFEHTAAPIVFTLLLFARLIMVYQSKSKPTYRPAPQGSRYDKKERSETESENTEQSELDDGAVGDRNKDD